MKECREWKETGLCRFAALFITVQMNPLYYSEAVNGSVLLNRRNFISCAPPAARNIYLTVMFDSLIIITCITSSMLCMRSVISGIRLQFVSNRNTQSIFAPLCSNCHSGRKTAYVYNIGKDLRLILPYRTYLAQQY